MAGLWFFQSDHMVQSRFQNHAQGLREVEGGHAPFPPLKKIYILVCILTKRILILALKFIYLAPSPQKIYKLTQEIQQIDNKKNL